MKATFTITVDIDSDIVALESRRRGRDFQTTLREIVGDVECRLVDAVRWHDGVVGIQSRVLRSVGALEPLATVQ